MTTMKTKMAIAEQKEQHSYLTDRWTDLRYHETQARYWNSMARFNVVPAGRRSGKTELAKRKLVTRAMIGTRFDRPRFFAGAPVRAQAKKLFWEDLKLLVPDAFKRGAPSESEMVIKLINSSEIHVVGMDKPERIEGIPWDGGVLDESANMKPEVWPHHVRPALSDRRGWCDKIGVPEGRNHFYRDYTFALNQMRELGDLSEYAAFHWISEDLLDPEEIALAKNELDEQTYNQEYRASFINFEGQCYYPFAQEIHCAPLRYNPVDDLIFCFDFNVAPGTAAIIQEQILPIGGILKEDGPKGTGVIGEVHIPINSNTPAVCRKIIQDWGDHRGKIFLYGDATGGSEKSSQTEGNDWDLVERELRPKFGDRMFSRVPQSNPSERARINAMNSRLKAMDGTIRLMVDPIKAPNVVTDFEGVSLLKGGSGEIDKKKDPRLTHHTDEIGYYIEQEFPVLESRTIIEELEL